LVLGVGVHASSTSTLNGFVAARTADDSVQRGWVGVERVVVGGGTLQTRRGSVVVGERRRWREQADVGVESTGADALLAHCHCRHGDNGNKDESSKIKLHFFRNKKKKNNSSVFFSVLHFWLFLFFFFKKEKKKKKKKKKEFDRTHYILFIYVEAIDYKRDL